MVGTIKYGNNDGRERGADVSCERENVCVTI